MECKIIIDGDLPKCVGITKAHLRRAAKYFALKSSNRVGVAFREVALILQDDPQSDQVHKAIMGVCGATDVITQAYESMPPEPEGIYGELYVNVDQALRLAGISKNWSAAKELMLYVAHGMDHLSGADDLDPKSRLTMRRRELRWLSEFIATTSEGKGLV